MVPVRLMMSANGATHAHLRPSCLQSYTREVRTMSNINAEELTILAWLLLRNLVAVAPFRMSCSAIAFVSLLVQHV